MDVGSALSRAACRCAAFFVGAACLAGHGAAAQSYKLSTPTGANVGRFEVSPDGRWAVYLDGRIHSVNPLGGESPVQLDPRPAYQRFFGISPDSRHVIYGAGHGPTHLTSARIDGSSSPVELAGTMGPFAITADSQTVVFQTNIGLYSVPLDGHASPVLIQESNRIFGFVLTPDSTRVVYVIEGIQAGGGLAYAADLDGSPPPVRLNNDNASTLAQYLLISPDSSRLVYRRGAFGTLGRLFSVPLDASSSPVPLSSFGSHVNWYGPTTPKITADGSLVVYEHDLVTDGELFVVPIEGGVPPRSLSGPLGDGYVTTYELLPDRTHLLLVYGTGSGQDRQLYRAALDGPESPLLLSAPVTTTYHFKLHPNGTVAIFTGRASFGAPIALWAVPVDGSAAPLELNAGDTAPYGVTNHLDGFGFAGQGDIVVYTTGREGDDPPEPEDMLQLHAVPLDASAPSQRIDGPTVRGGSVRYTGDTFRGIIFRVAANGKRVLYLADQRMDRVVELFGAPLPNASEGGRFGRFR
ncbi:MAG: hypothetical protein HOP15_10690 [Planctomycetes bacterium]|nr:hypothetical protein [Planctomycetota bacterium]